MWKSIILCALTAVFAGFLLVTQSLAQTKEQGITLYKEAETLREKAKSKEDLRRAAAKYEEAVNIFEKVNFQQGIGWATNGLGIVYGGWGQYPKAAEHFEKSLELSRKTGDVRGEGNALGNLGNVFKDWGQLPKAVEYFEKSLELKRKTGDVRGEGNTLNNLGLVHEAWRQYAKAVEYYEKSLELSRKTGHVRGEGQTLNNLGMVYADWGQYPKAVEHYEKSLELKRKTGDLGGEGNTLNNLGEVFRACGQYQKAAECYDRSLEIAKRIGDVRREGKTLMNLGLVWERLGEYHQALAMYQKGLGIYTKIGVSTAWPNQLIGDLWIEMGDPVKAEPFLREASILSSLARLGLATARFGDAKLYYEVLLKKAEKDRNADDLFTVYTGKGLAHEGTGHFAEAARYFRKAIDHTEDVRLSLPSRERDKFFDVKIGGFLRTAPYEGLARVLARVNLNRPMESLKVSDYTRARIFGEKLTRRLEGTNIEVPNEVLERDAGLNQQLGALSKSLQKGYEIENKEVIEVLEPQVREAKEKLAAHVDMLRKQYPLFAATKYPQPMDISQTALRDDEWVLSYEVTDSGIVIVLTKGKSLVKGLFKPVPRKEVDELVRKFREPLEVAAEESIVEKAKQFDFASGKKLSDLLLADVLPDLPKGTPVIIIPDDSLGVLPFEMLVLNDGGKILTDKKMPYASGAEFFGDRNPISYYQSITALTLARTLGKHQKGGDKLIAMVDPVFSEGDPRLVQMAKEEKNKILASLPKDLLMSIQTETKMTFPRLPLTGELGQSLKKAAPDKTDLYEGLKAKKATLLEKDLTDYRSVVFATHGYFGKDLPGIMEPVLVLTLLDQTKDQDGFLRLSEVMGLKINADIVALTACQTGLGRHISGEGTMGMGRAFQYAGAKSVLMSLWSVSETSSVKLVESFFKHLKEGKNKLESLRLARKEIRDAGYDHPFFWAPFILVGEVE